MGGKTTKKCKHCVKEIEAVATRCSQCRGWQGWRSWVFETWPVVMALLVALLTVGTAFVNALSRALTDYEDRVTLELMGTDARTGAVDLFFSNLGNRSAAIQKATLIFPEEVFGKLGSTRDLILPVSSVLRPEDAGQIRLESRDFPVPQSVGEQDSGYEYELVIEVRRFNQEVQIVTLPFKGAID